MPLSVVIQAGGKSRRMGQNKALVPFLNQTLIEWVIERVRPIADEILITSNPPEVLSFLHLPTYPDILPGIGALGGLYTAFSIARHSLVAVIACDMAFANAPLLAAERDLLIARQADGVVPETEKGVEPFHAVYFREPCLAAVRAALDEGQKRADSWFGRVRMEYFPRDQLVKYDPLRIAFLNLNTPAELKDVEERARAILRTGLK
jgi:molybdopterin-guanine dinucleotide biosynthesis protein A